MSALKAGRMDERKLLEALWLGEDSSTLISILQAWVESEDGAPKCLLVPLLDRHVDDGWIAENKRVQDLLTGCDFLDVHVYHRPLPPGPPFGLPPIPPPGLPFGLRPPRPPLYIPRGVNSLPPGPPLEHWEFGDWKFTKNEVLGGSSISYESALVIWPKNKRVQVLCKYMTRFELHLWLRKKHQVKTMSSEEVIDFLQVLDSCASVPAYLLTHFIRRDGVEKCRDMIKRLGKVEHVEELVLSGCQAEGIAAAKIVLSNYKDLTKKSIGEDSNAATWLNFCMDFKQLRDEAVWLLNTLPLSHYFSKCLVRTISKHEEYRDVVEACLEEMRIDVVERHANAHDYLRLIGGCVLELGCRNKAVAFAGKLLKGIDVARWMVSKFAILVLLFMDSEILPEDKLRTFETKIALVRLKLEVVRKAERIICLRKDPRILKIIAEKFLAQLLQSDHYENVKALFWLGEEKTLVCLVELSQKGFHGVYKALIYRTPLLLEAMRCGEIAREVVMKIVKGRLDLIESRPRLGDFLRAMKQDEEPRLIRVQCLKLLKDFQKAESTNEAGLLKNVLEICFGTSVVGNKRYLETTEREEQRKKITVRNYLDMHRSLAYWTE